jgi:regulator of protease activity HflC (stomatin/prohibitin superfamily)
VTEQEARFLPGLRMLALGLAGVLAGVILAIYAHGQHGGAAVALGLICALIFLASALVLAGLTPVAPGRARVVQLFGRYRGTIRTPGLQWVNPFTRRIVVTIQTETAVRHIANSYPYTSSREGELALRDNADEVTGELSTEIAARVAPAGVHIIESRLTRLSYAAEIAQVMLRQQQASAVVGARQRIVEGAVGMVQLALQRLQDEDVVELDEERKASMVSNLLVVLCSDQATQPIVNTGTLYQ